MSREFKVTLTPADEALFKFDAENNVEPARTIAERLALKWSTYLRPEMVDDIACAIEDARNLGERRGIFTAPLS
jgi:hypothetical protein